MDIHNQLTLIFVVVAWYQKTFCITAASILTYKTNNNFPTKQNVNITIQEASKKF